MFWGFGVLGFDLLALEKMLLKKEEEKIMAKEKLKPTGKRCRVCRGEIVEKYVYQAFVSIPHYGNPSDWGWVSKGKFCKGCRIKYE